MPFNHNWVADICKRHSRFHLLYSLLMMRSACGKISLWRKAKGWPVKMLEILLLVDLMSLELSFSKILSMLVGK